VASTTLPQPSPRWEFAGPGWNAGRLDLMLLAGGILLFLAGPGKAAIDAVWLEKK